MSLLQLCGLLFVGSAILTGLFRLAAQRIHLMDTPVARSAHSNPIPVGGGISIALLVLLVVVFYYSAGLIPSNEFAAIMAAAVIAGLGMIDDVRHLDVRWRIPTQFVASCFVVYCLADVPAIDFGLFIFPESVLLNIFAIFALVWLMNLFNFMDGIDGIAATELVSVNLVSLVIVANSDDIVTLLSASFAAASAGFLLWNWAPAKIFMGDVGSSFIGFMLGVMAMLSMLHGSMTVWTWVLLLGVFIVDSTLTLVKRYRRGLRWYEGHASHAYQHAARHYKSHAKVTITVVAINLLWLAPLAWLSVQYPRMGLAITLVGLLPLILLASHYGAGEEEFVPEGQRSS